MISSEQALGDGGKEKLLCLKKKKPSTEPGSDGAASVKTGWGLGS